MLKVESLDQHYGESHTLWEMNLDVPAGACLCLLGRNGVGKTTLLKTVMGLVKSSGGVIRFDGTDITQIKAEKRAELGIGYVPQGREIFPLLTVEENLKTGLRAAPKIFGNKIPESVFEIFPVLKAMLKRRGGDLSGGQQQQLAIGRALVINPRLLILDEPTEGIQPNIVSEIGDVIKRLNRGLGKVPAAPAAGEPRFEIHEAVSRINRELGVTVLLVEQKLPFARKIADSFCIMDRGRGVAAGAINQLNDDLVKRYLTV
ncbi:MULTISPECIES: ABC transporter ATP-binding protein [Methylomicrobium]|uniref:ABC-type branched-chain amino acid transport system, ATPase component n=1 Tax=Methylomicrobium album BG8 TaxID=686340 RepID=H8GNX1_METAL|nr:MULTISPECIES: ABC transporter ATP-binding protein [Methylomicrobium]EIC28393.1 ABC-type branched-chain amino acid transport system, ATPase component [Methylomicrobium album BG8]